MEQMGSMPALSFLSPDLSTGPFQGQDTDSTCPGTSWLLAYPLSLLPLR
jgi:hypothetical protein